MEFCGEFTWSLWQNQSIGFCFTELAFHIPASSLLVFCNVLLCVKAFNSLAFEWPFSKCMNFRICNSFACFIKSTCIFFYYLSFFIFSETQINILILTHFGIECLCWLSIVIFDGLHGKSNCFHSRGPLLSVILEVIYFYSIAIQLWSAILQLPFQQYKLIIGCFIFDIIVLACHVLTKVPIIYPIEEDRKLRARLIRQSQTPNNKLLNLPSSFSIPAIIFNDADESIVAENGESSALCLSKLFFCWINKTLTRGYYGELFSSNCLPVIADSLSSNLLENSLHIQSFEDQRNGNFSSALPFIKIFFLRFGKEIIVLGCVKFLYSALSLSSPVFLNMFIVNVAQVNVIWWNAAFWGGALLFSRFATTILSIIYDYWTPRFGFKTKVAVTSLVYRQIFKHNISSLSEFSTGNLVNLLTSDTERIVNLAPSLNELWAMPLQFVIAIILLYFQLGSSCFVGVAFLVFLLPLNRFIASRIASYSSSLMRHKDTRVKFISEVLQSMTTVKLSCWEVFMQKKILGARQFELQALRGQKMLDAACVFLWAACPSLLAGSTFATFVALGNELKPAEVFTSLALFNMLIGPMNAFPWVINGVVEAWISASRICCLFHLNNVEVLCADWDTNDDSTQTTTGIYQEALDEGESILNLLPDLRTTTVIHLKADCFYWQSPEKPALFNVDMHIHKGNLICILGPMASGKSSLLLALMGDLRAVENKSQWATRRNGQRLRFAYVGVTPWLQKGTVRANILFGSPLDADWLRAVVNGCGLTDDISEMPRGLETEVGEAGSRLSGGQRARVALARAVYQRADVYLLDDPLAALDVNVAREIAKKCLGSKGLLKDKTRIIATHKPDWLVNENASLGAPADLVIRLFEGRIVDSIASRITKTDFSESLSNDGNNSSLSPSRSPTVTANTVNEKNADLDEVKVEVEEEEEDDDDDDRAPLLHSERSSTQMIELEEDRDNEETANWEKLAFGSIQSAVYKSYIRAVGYCLAIQVMLWLTLMQASRNGLDYWLSYWMEQTTNTTTSLTYIGAVSEPLIGSFNSLSEATTINNSIILIMSQQTDTSNFYLSVYAGIIGANLVFTVIRAVLFAIAGLAAASTIHKRMLDSVLQGEMSFFDQTPLGRILNRFSSDVGTIDDSLPFRLNILLATVFALFGAVVVTCIALPSILIICMPLLFAYWSVQRIYRAAARDLKRLSSIARSPVYAHFSETIAGLIVIRGFCRTRAFRQTSGARLNEQTRCELASLAASAWLNLRLQIIACLEVAGVIIAALIGRILGITDASLAGLAVIYALLVASLMTSMVSGMTEVEKDFVAVERCRELQEETPIELDKVALSVTAPQMRHQERVNSSRFLSAREHSVCSTVDLLWPQNGRIVFSHVNLIYPTIALSTVINNDEQPFALDDICLELEEGERVGIVGRTGSGKSSLLKVLFRLLNHMPGPVSTPKIAAIRQFRGVTGTVKIDDVDIRGIPLHVLRSRMLCISQDPFLFSGTVRANLDPSGSSNDEQLVQVLMKCGLVTSSSAAMILLDTEVGESGRCLSAGQRQLICLARALFRTPRPKVICLDEATASLDDAGDEKIHNLLAAEFPRATLILVAHRLSSVLRCCSRVVVMSFGRIVETGPPSELAQQPSSYFGQMLREHSYLNETT